MRGRSREYPYMCMFCGHETKTHEQMVNHFMFDHKEHWSFIKKKSELEEECWHE